jgi:hypothetical protein
VTLSSPNLAEVPHASARGRARSQARTGREERGRLSRGQRKVEELRAPTASFIDFVCECAQVDCVEQILLTVSEYEALRREPERFAVSSGHDNPDVDRVVAEGERYVVVEKIGTGAATARRLDPRGSGSEE